MIAKENIEKALALIKKGSANTDYFFEKLTSPAWIKPLSEQNLFSTPYPAERRGETFIFPIWTPGVYLARMASIPDAQRQVTELLERLPVSDNPRVYEVVADAAISLPPPLARRLVPQLLKGLALPFELMLPEKAADTIVHLAGGNLGVEALSLAKALFAIVPSPLPAGEPEDEGESRWLPREAKARFADWRYGELLERCLKGLVRSSGMEAFRLLCDLLERAVAEGRKEAAEGPQDYSYIWRPTIEHPESHRDDVRDELVSAVRDAGKLITETSPELSQELIQHLVARPSRIFHRIALFLLDLRGEHMLPQVHEALSNPDDWEDVGLRPEYEYLMAHFFERLSPETQQRFLKWVDKGPDVDRYAASRKRMDGREPTLEEVNRDRDAWTRDHLGVISDHLPDSHKARFEALVASIGTPREPGPLFRVSVGIRGARSPLTEEETLSLDWATLISKMRDWAPPAADFEGPSEEGLAGSVRQRVSNSPREAVRHLDQVVEVDPRYIATILEALREALKAKEELEWEPLLAFIARVVDEAQASTDLLDRWRWVSKCVASLIEDGFDAGAASIPIALRNQVWQILRRLAANPDPTPEYETRYGGDNMDPATLSLNTVRGETLHGVIRYALWWRRHFESRPDADEQVKRGFEELPEVRALLDEHLDSTVEPSLAVRAVYGQWFPWLVLLDPRWSLAHLRQIFPAEGEEPALFWAAWGTYVVFCQPFTNVLPVLRPVYVEAIRATKSGMSRQVGIGERPSEHLAEHIMAYYWRGELSLAKDDLVVAFFEAANPDLCGHALEWVGRALAGLEKPPSPEVQARLQALWEWRAKQLPVAAEELQAFGWWFSSGQLDQAWALQTLEATLATSVLPEPDHMVVERLAVIARGNPVAAVRCLEHMVDLASEGWSIHGWLDSARAVLEAGLRWTDTEANECAKRVIHRLGALRFRDFRDLLQAVAGSREGQTR